MEEENKQEIPQTNESTTSAKPKFDFKKYLPLACIVVAVIAVIAVLIALFSGGPKKAVKKYVKAFNSLDAKKVINCIDIAGMSAGYGIDSDDFTDEDYKEFKEAYKEVSKDDIKEAKEYMTDALEDTFKEIKEEAKSYKVKIKKFKDVKKINKDLYEVTTELNIKGVPKDEDEDEVDETEEATFIVYKGKIIGGSGLL